MAYEPEFRYSSGELDKLLQACPRDTPQEMVSTYFREQYPDRAEAEWKMARFLNFQGYLKQALETPEIRDEFVTEIEAGLVYMDPSFLTAVWQFLGHAPEHLLGKAPPMPQTIEMARRFRGEQEGDG